MCSTAKHVGTGIYQRSIGPWLGVVLMKEGPGVHPEPTQSGRAVLDSLSKRWTQSNCKPICKPTAQHSMAQGITNHRQLEIYDYRNALDGPGDLTLLNHLASAENNDEDSVVQATKSIGRLAEIFDAMSRRA